MIRHLIVALSLAVLTACSPAGEGGAGAAPAAAAAEPGAAPGGADEAIRGWINQQVGADLIGDPEIFYGDFTGDGANDALAYFLTPLGANNFNVNWALFRNEGGSMTFVRTDESVFGTEPRNVAFSTGQITLTTTMPREGDARCCPTGSQDWTIDTN